MPTKTLMGLALLVVVSVACGGSDGGAASDGSAGCDQPVATTSVTLTDVSFEPSCIGADAGASLELRNTGSTPHTFTLPDTSVNTEVGAGDSANVQLTGLPAGTYDVICTYHTQMKATLIVT
jgi:plastocyanin